MPAHLRSAQPTPLPSLRPSAQTQPTQFTMPKTTRVQRAPYPQKKPASSTTPSRKPRKCVCCKQHKPHHLFLAMAPKKPNDYTEMCFKCRRMGSIVDYIKTHTKPGSGAAHLTMVQQQEHLEMQSEAIRRWTRMMRHRDIEIAQEYLDEGGLINCCLAAIIAENDH